MKILRFFRNTAGAENRAQSCATSLLPPPWLIVSGALASLMLFARIPEINGIALAAWAPLFAATGIRALARVIHGAGDARARAHRRELEDARCAAVARIDAARDREQKCRSRLDHLFRVRELVRTLGSSMRVNDILNAFGRAATETLGARMAVIHFRDSSGQSRNILLNPMPSPLQESEARQIWKTANARGVVTRDLRGSHGEAILLDFRPLPDEEAMRFRPAAGSAPQGRCADEPETRLDSEIDEDAVDILASVVGLSLEKAFLFQRVENLAQIDSVTGLHNRRSLEESFATEWGRARYMNQPLSAVMIDIDRFKEVNDTHGHAAGDLVLKAVADALRRTLRDIDVVARYGGEEFVVLLPETDLAKARIAAERMRVAVENLQICVPRPGRVMSQGAPLLRITISSGVVSHVGRCSPEDMLAGADEALYRAKRNGRNRSEVMENPAREDETVVAA